MSDLRERYDFLFDGSGDLTQETLLLYVFGPLENGARDAVEQHLEECEMCRDAAEGLALLGTKEQALAALAIADAKLLERLEQLKQKVTSSGREALIDKTAAADPVVLKAKKPVRTIGWYRYAAAASVIILIGAAFWWVNVNLNNEMSPLSMNQTDSLVVLDEQKGLERLKTQDSEEVDAESSRAGDTVSVTDNGGTANYSYEWTDGDVKDKAPSPFTATGSPHANSSPSATNDEVAPSAALAKPASPKGAPGYIADEEVVYADTLLYNLEEVAMAPPAPAAKSKAPASEKPKKKQEEMGNGANNTASRKDVPAPNEGAGNSIFSDDISNMADKEASLYQAQYPGGSTAIQKYFDQLAYPKDLAKGAKGIVVFEVQFDNSGKITTATVVSGLGEPYDKLLLDHLKKMPNWTAPTPNGEPIESLRMVTVEVNVK